MEPTAATEEITKNTYAAPHRSGPLPLGVEDAGDDVFTAMLNPRRVPLTERARTSRTDRSPAGRHTV